MKYIKIIIAIIILLPGSVLLLYKPSRTLFPEIFGISCRQKICIDNPALLDKAQQLLNTARAQLQTKHSLSISNPTIIFCSTESCKNTFGLGQRAAYTLGSLRIAIAPRGWTIYFVAHELIHYWQAENFGTLALLRAESWLIEGMAYALSDDPRTPLKQPFESYRQQFSNWYRLTISQPLKNSFAEEL